MSAFFHIMALPFLACLVLAGIHAYLGFHVIERQVIFVDLALAQIAVLGASFALLAGYDMDTSQSYWLSLGFTVIGAAIFSLTRFKKQRVPHEAIIGIVYAVSAAIGLFHYICRRPFLMISADTDQAFQSGIHVKLWDFLFYVSFGCVVTSSVKVAGVLLVFSFLVVPSVCAILFSNKMHVRLILGWIVGFTASVLGMIVSYYLDYPTGASVVCVFGAILLFAAIVKKMIRLA